MTVALAWPRARCTVTTSHPAAVSEEAAARLARLKAAYGDQWSIDPQEPGSTTFVAAERATGQRIVAINLVELADKLE